MEATDVIPPIPFGIHLERTEGSRGSRRVERLHGELTGLDRSAQLHGSLWIYRRSHLEVSKHRLKPGVNSFHVDPFLG
jgi:hypothetical protein